jgi:NADPH:quinone reductase-like Zn-dependent oxidoreductase
MSYSQVAVTHFGESDALQLRRVADQTVAAEQVLVSVETTGVAFADVLMRRGLYPGVPRPPFVPGYDIVGKIEQVGTAVSGFQPGQRVAALIVYGGYSNYVSVSPDRLVPVPPTIDAAQAVAVVLNYLTAYQMLYRVFGRMTAGTRMLVHAAGGGVGTALLELGALAGAEMFGTASKGKHASIRALGAVPIDYQQEDFVQRIEKLTPGGVDIVLDAISGQHLYRSYNALAKGGMLISYGVTHAVKRGARSTLSLLPYVLPVGLLRLRPGRQVKWYDIGSATAKDLAAYRADLLHLFDMLQTGRINPIVADQLPLHQAALAHQRLEQGRVTGKLVLTHLA